MTYKINCTAPVASTLLLLMLSACGGGGGAGSASNNAAVGTLGTVTVSGTAATGKAISNAPIQAICSNGTFNSQTNATGAFTIALSDATPCVINTTFNGHALRALYTGGNAINITPLTELLTRYLLARSGLGINAPADQVVASATLAALVSNPSEIDEAEKAVQARILKQYGVDIGPTFLTEPLVAPASNKDPQNDADKALDSISAAGGFNADQSPKTTDSDNLVSQASSFYRLTGIALPANSTALHAVEGKPISSALCFNPGMFNAGYTFNGTYAFEQGTTKGGFTTTQSVQAVTFEGQAAMALTTSTNLNALVDSLYFTTSGTDIQFLGELASTTAQGKTVEEKTVYSPAVLEKDFDLNLGESQNRVLSGRTLTSTRIAGGAPTQSSLSAYSTEKVTFTGLEAVNTPAGQFLACRIDQEAQSSAGTETTSSWYGVGSGALLKESYPLDNGNGGITEAHISLVNASINGQAFP